MLFAKGKRPDRTAIRTFVASQRAILLTHDPEADRSIHLVANDGHSLSPSDSETSGSNSIWLELLREGLVFDLVGLAPGGKMDLPVINHQFDMAEMPDPAECDPIQLLPGPHVSAGANSLPVAKALVGLVSDLLCHFDDLVAVVWPPSNSVIGRRFFESTTSAWISGGPFPALGLTAFRETLDGAVQSVGLEYWIGQEIRIEPPLSADPVAATRLGVRLVNQLVILGGIDGTERIVGPDGSRLLLTLSRNQKFIRVSRE